MDIDKIMELEGETLTPEPTSEKAEEVKTEPVEQESDAPKSDDTPKKGWDDKTQKRFKKVYAQRKQAEEDAEKYKQQAKELEERLKQFEDPKPKLKKSDFGEGPEAEERYYDYINTTNREEILKEFERRGIKEKADELNQQADKVVSEAQQEINVRWQEEVQQKAIADPEFTKRITEAQVDWSKLQPVLQTLPNGIDIVEEISKDPNMQFQVQYASADPNFLRMQLMTIGQGLLTRNVQQTNKPAPMPKSEGSQGVRKKNPNDEKSFDEIERDMFASKFRK